MTDCGVAHEPEAHPPADWPEEIKRQFDEMARQTRALARDTSDIDETWRRIEACFDRGRGRRG